MISNKANGGYEIKGWCWSGSDCDKFCAWIVGMYYGNTNINRNGNYNYVRAVSALNK